MSEGSIKTRLAVDIGGTFTDVALSHGGQDVTTKVLTTPSAPEQGVLEGIGKVLAESGLAAGDIGLFIHGTTLATNALIERKGAKTALITTEGQRDSLEMAYENRFAQYDIQADRPKPLVPRHLRWPVRERLDWRGQVLRALDEDSVAALIPEITAAGVESLGVGLIHAYANPNHERRVAEILGAALPDLYISLSSEVAPEIREYERQSTTVANAYVQPLMARYLTALDRELKAMGLGCPLFLMTSGGGLTTFEAAVRFPIRLVESGPAGGAILASRIARQCGLDQVVSFDMGGTTAKICLIDDGQPLLSRSFEVAREYRYMKGSGLPLKIPVIEMVEIGAGGGSIVSVDGVKRLQVGPESAGAEPGPACYGRGGKAPTVTDADVVMGRIEPARFAGGSVPLDPEKAEAAVQDGVGAALSLGTTEAAFGISEMVDEAMANASRVHAIEWGKDIARRTMIAFGGAAPLHAARLAEKLEIERLIVPTGAGVGSALGFLSAPVAFEVVRTRYQKLADFDAAAANDLLAEMRAEAEAIVRLGAPDQPLTETRSAAMRYIGQGHEITVELPPGSLATDDAGRIRIGFEETYRRLYGQTVEDLEIEILSWALTLAGPVAEPARIGAAPSAAAPEPEGRRTVFDPGSAADVDMAVFAREVLTPGMQVDGPALIVEAQTTTVVPPSLALSVNELGYLDLRRRNGETPS